MKSKVKMVSKDYIVLIYLPLSKTSSSVFNLSYTFVYDLSPRTGMQIYKFVPLM